MHIVNNKILGGIYMSFSWWDGFIFAMIAIAIFRGYYRGLAQRLTGWVGFIISSMLVLSQLNRINAWLKPTVDGHARTKEWLLDYFTARAVANPDNGLEDMKQWVGSLFLPDFIKEELYTALNKSAEGIYHSIYSQMANILATPVWHFILFVTATMVVVAILIVIGVILHHLFERVYVLCMIDKFLGAFVSGVIMVVVVGIFTALCLFIMPEHHFIGEALHHSFMAPRLQEAFNVVIKGGLGG